jgi:predicted acyl esterase
LKRLLVTAIVALVAAGPAQAYVKSTGTRTMDDGVSIAYDLYTPDGTAPAGGWPGVVVLHGLGGTKDSMATIAGGFADHGYAALAYTARGHGTSGGDVDLAGPRETTDERALFDWFRGLPQVGDRVGAWGISYGGGQIWNGLAAGIPYAAADVVETWTDLYSALWPGDVAKSGIVLGFAKTVEARSPLVTALEDDAVHSTNIARLRELGTQRSALGSLTRVTTPVYMFQGRVDYAFDLTQATVPFARLAGPKRLYVGQFGHAPSTFPGPDVDFVLAQGLAWLDRFVKGTPNGIDKGPKVTLAAATGSKRASYAGLPPTKIVSVGFRGVSKTLPSSRLGPIFHAPLETFGVSLLKVQVQKLVGVPRLVATVTAGKRVITHGAVVPRKGLVTIRLANYAQYLPKATRLRVTFAPDSTTAGDLAYLGFGNPGTIVLGPAILQLQALTKPVSG